MTPYSLTHNSLLRDLYIAFGDARKHKASKRYVSEFEVNLKENIQTLCDDLWDRTYEPLPSKCFIVNCPKKREVFAAQFRDRVVHHLLYNYIHEMFERTFIEDCYSCIKNKGTLYGVERLKSHIRKESHNWTRECYAMKLDIRGYFIHINRRKLLNITLTTLNKLKTHRINKNNNLMWEETIDINFVSYLIKKIIMIDPVSNCIKVGWPKAWIGLENVKSLFHTDYECGLPVGNLTSQLFSNIYLNVFDQFMKRTLKCRHYGRYVDDAYVISTNKEWMKSLVPEIKRFLKDELGLDLHMGKLLFKNVKYGIEFLGAFIKPYRIYVSNNALRRISKHIDMLKQFDNERIYRSVNSYLGILSHMSTYNIKYKLFINKKFLKISSFDKDISKMNKLIFTCNTKNGVSISHL